jgi:hypothetical protein
MNQSVKKYKRFISLVVILLPIVALVITGYFDNKTNGCYQKLNEARYNVTIAYFDLSNLEQEDQVTNLLPGSNISPVNPSILQQDATNLKEYISYLDNEFNLFAQQYQLPKLGVLLQGTDETPMNINSTTEKTLNQEINNLGLLLFEFSTNQMVSSSQEVALLSKEESELEGQCNSDSSLATLFLYISLATSVIIPVAKWGFWQ